MILDSKFLIQKNMLEQIVQNIPPELATLLLAMMPVVELRGAIPLALGMYEMNLYLAFTLAVIGNMVPVFFLLWFLDTFAHYLMERVDWINKLLTKVFERTHLKANAKLAKYGTAGLILLVAIPLPMTGAWTGSIAAWLFGIPYKKAIGLIFIGVVIAGLIMTGASLGFISIF